jgi:hypothetical protein
MIHTQKHYSTPMPSPAGANVESFL